MTVLQTWKVCSQKGEAASACVFICTGTVRGSQAGVQRIVAKVRFKEHTTQHSCRDNVVYQELTSGILRIFRDFVYQVYLAYTISHYNIGIFLVYTLNMFFKQGQVSMNLNSNVYISYLSVSLLLHIHRKRLQVCLGMGMIRSNSFRFFHVTLLWWAIRLESPLDQFPNCNTSLA